MISQLPAGRPVGGNKRRTKVIHSLLVTDYIVEQTQRQITWCRSLAPYATFSGCGDSLIYLSEMERVQSE